MTPLVALLLAALVQDARPRAEYTIGIVDPAARHATVAIELTNLPAEASELELAFAERFAFVTFPQAQVHDPWDVVVGDQLSQVERTGPFAWRIPCAPAKRSAVAFKVPLDLRDSPLVDERGDYEMPLLTEDCAMLSCGALLPAPKVDGIELRVRFELPEGWAVHAPWPQVEPGVWAPRDTLSLQDTLVALGRWEVHESTADGAHAVALFAPSEARLAAEVAPLVQALFATEIELFGGAPLERYLFLFAPSRVRGFAGSAKQGAMVLSVGAHTPVQAVKPYAAHLIAHEFFHTWGAARYACPDELRFFNEGFTDFFAYEATRRIGALSDQALQDTIGEKLGAYERSARATGLSLVQAGGPVFFQGGAAYDQVYAGGLVLAALCQKVLSATGSGQARGQTLDGFLRAFNNDPRWSRDGTAPTLSDFLEQLSRQGGAKLASRVRALIETPTADLESALIEAGCRLERRQEPAPLELRANLDGTRLVDLDPRCAAAQIGLRAGDRLIEVNGVQVAGPADCHSAFAQPRAGRLQITLERDGAQELIDAAPPMSETIAFRWQ